MIREVFQRHATSARCTQLNIVLCSSPLFSAAAAPSTCVLFYIGKYTLAHTDSNRTVAAAFSLRFREKSHSTRWIYFPARIRGVTLPKRRNPNTACAPAGEWALFPVCTRARKGKIWSLSSALLWLCAGTRAMNLISPSDKIAAVRVLYQESKYGAMKIESRWQSISVGRCVGHNKKNTQRSC